MVFQLNLSHVRSVDRKNLKKFKFVFLLTEIYTFLSLLASSPMGRIKPKNLSHTTVPLKPGFKSNAPGPDISRPALFGLLIPDL
jgi:hypothetical protein